MNHQPQPQVPQVPCPLLVPGEGPRADPCPQVVRVAWSPAAFLFLAAASAGLWEALEGLFPYGGLACRLPRKQGGAHPILSPGLLQTEAEPTPEPCATRDAFSLGTEREKPQLLGLESLSDVLKNKTQPSEHEDVIGFIR